MDGQIAAREDAPPEIVLKTPRDRQQFVDYGSKNPASLAAGFEFEIETIHYFRELVPHRTGCVTYFDSLEARTAAYQLA